MAKELAIIHKPGVGTRDVDKAVFWFEVETLNYSALQVMSWEDAGKLIEKHKIENLKNLEGKPCVVEVKDGTIVFVDLKGP